MRRRYSDLRAVERRLFGEYLLQRTELLRFPGGRWRRDVPPGSGGLPPVLLDELLRCPAVLPWFLVQQPERASYLFSNRHVS